ncbi:hypothetical protein MHEI_00150 [Mycobacterium heidelbergense]|nr:hypothetical protein MHEI_00150 [Mycobacterium heidelbergense]
MGVGRDAATGMAARLRRSGSGFGAGSDGGPHLTGLAMLSALNPRPPIWPLIVLGYCAVALSPPTLILALSTRRTVRANRIQRWLVRVLTRCGPATLRIVLFVVGVGLVVDALAHHGALW